MTFRFDRSVFAGMSPTALQAALDSAQAALIALSTGSQVAMVSYGQGDGIKTTQFRATDSGALVQLINLLQACLGQRPHARRAFGVSF